MGATAARTRRRPQRVDAAARIDSLPVALAHPTADPPYAGRLRPRDSTPTTRLLSALCAWAWISLAASPVAAEANADAPQPERAPYRTPREGEAYTARVFGREFHAPARDLRRIVAVDVGIVATFPNTGGIPVVPIGAGFVFWRPDEDRFVDAIVAGIENDVLAAWSPPRMGRFEIVTVFSSSTIPAARSEIIEGEQREEIELVYGDVRVGAGLGYRRQVGLTIEDMMSINVTVEPGFLYFKRGPDTASDFDIPPDTFEILVRARFRYDDFERNLLSLIHSGFGFGAEALYGHRAQVADWGIDGAQNGEDARDFGLVRGYLQGARGVPWVHSDRHRMAGAIHFGAGVALDRFSAPRVGGGPDTDQFRAIRRPVIPGAALREFYPRGYVIMQGEYRYELPFVSFIGMTGSVSNVTENAESLSTRRDPHRWLSSLGGRWTSAFFFRSRMRLDYSYNFNVIRNDSLGGHAINFDVSREF